MGLADLVPGVSGATVALVLGIYPRALDAVSGIGWRMARRLRRAQFRAQLVVGARDPGSLVNDADGRDAGRVLLLASLALGVGLAIAGGSRVLPPLLDEYPGQMGGLFFGLVLASVAVPIRRMERRTVRAWGLALAAALAAFWLTGLRAGTSGHAQGSVLLELERPAAEELVLTSANTTLWASDAEHGLRLAYGLARPATASAGTRSVRADVVARMAGTAANLPPGALRDVRAPVPVASVSQTEPLAGGRDPALAYVFAAGVLAISAMSLPGLSGSFVLLALGLYGYVVHALRATLYHGDAGAAIVVATMIVAMTVGLLTFARILRRLFSRWPDAALAALAGLMLGSLRALWPFARHAPDGAEVAALPIPGDPAVPGIVLMFAAGVLAVALLEGLARRRAAKGLPCPRQDSNLGPTA